MHMQSQLAVWQHPTGIFSAFSQFSPSRTTWIRIFNFRATTLLAVIQHPVMVLVALACLGPGMGIDSHIHYYLYTPDQGL